MRIGRVWAIVAGLLALCGAAEGQARAERSAAPAVARPVPPLPPPRPDRPPPLDEPAEARPKEDSSVPPAPKSEAAVPVSEDEACRERLTRLGVRFETRPPLSEGRCGAAHPLLVSGLAEDLDIAPAATMTCPVAEALARWALEVLKPESERHLKDKPAKLLIGTSYECRNQRSGAKPSEHAFANGVDLMGFAFAARPKLPVGTPADGSPERAFQDAARKGACAYFTTVLGPGSDAAHADHLHLDMRIRKGSYRICQ